VNAYHYTLKYRPPGICTCPVGWELMESGTGGFFPLRTDLPRGEHRFGVIRYRRELTPRELETYEMILLPLSRCLEECNGTNT
jgi:hypothetical protein